jgi:hemerythrin-like domain-containing protein
MEITELLKEDHREAEGLIAELENGGDRETFNKLQNALKLHTQIEEAIFYPALEDFDETDGLVSEAYSEHDDVDELLETMSQTDPQSEDFQDYLSDLKDSIEHHVEEEENELFPLAEEILGADTLEQMGERMEKMKEKSGRLGASG